VLGLAVGHAAMYGPQASFLSELFGTKVRYSGVSLGYNLASIFAGALSPLIATGLMAAYKPETWPISVYMIGLALITIVSVYSHGDTKQRRGLNPPAPIVGPGFEGSNEVSQHPALPYLRSSEKGKIVTAAEAVRLIRDGDTVATGGFVGIGFAEKSRWRWRSAISPARAMRPTPRASRAT